MYKNQLKTRVTNTFKIMAVHYSYIFRHVCTVFRNFIHQISKVARI